MFWIEDGCVRYLVVLYNLVLLDSDDLIGVVRFICCIIFKYFDLGVFFFGVFGDKFGKL